jgi:hypothetical protein
LVHKIASVIVASWHTTSQMEHIVAWKLGETTHETQKWSSNHREEVKK